MKKLALLFLLPFFCHAQILTPILSGLTAIVATPLDSNSGGGCTGSSPTWACTGAATVTITDATANFIRYTVDGSTPSYTAGTLYSTPFTSPGATFTLKAIGCSLVNDTCGGILTSVYTISGGGGVITLNSTLNSTRLGSGTNFAFTPTAGHSYFQGINFDSGTLTVSSTTCTGAACTWVQVPSCVAHSTTAGEGTDWWYMVSAPASVTDLKVTLSGSANYQAVVYDVSGNDTSTILDGACVIIVNHAAAANPNGAPITTTVSGDLILTTIVTATNVTAVGGGFTMDAIDSSGGGHAHDLTTTSGTFTPAWTQSSGAYAASTIAVKHP